jgi:hypothetical protein
MISAHLKRRRPPAVSARCPPARTPAVVKLVPVVRAGVQGAGLGAKQHAVVRVVVVDIQAGKCRRNTVMEANVLYAPQIFRALGVVSWSGPVALM